MYTINDPMFSLILRFVSGYQNIIFRDDKFMRKQLKAIRKHIAQFPAEEQESRAIEWIEVFAQEYRETWEKDFIDETFSHDRCSDCPLVKTDDSERCQIHDEWTGLLKKYATDKINSKKYVKNTLKLLTQHKENLKIKLSLLKNE